MIAKGIGRPVYRGLRGWREHQTTGQVTSDVTERVGGPFQEVSLSVMEDSRGDTLLQDSILLLPALVTVAECATLIKGAEVFFEEASAAAAADGEPPSDAALWRIQCHSDGSNLDEQCHALAHIILSRALWCVECMRPELAAAIFPDACDLGDMWFKFDGEEPTINRCAPRRSNPRALLRRLLLTPALRHRHLRW